jgi:hypothetical protein
MKKDNGKEQYRKKPYTPLFKKHLDKGYRNFIDKFKRIYKKSPINVLQFLMDKFEKNNDLKVIVFCKNDTLREMLIDLGNKGANLSLINDILKPPEIPEYLKDDHPFTWQLYGGEFAPGWNQKVEEYKLKKKELNNKKKTIKGAIGQIKSLEPVPETKRFQNETPFINTKLMEAQNALKELERVIDKYFEAKAISEGIVTYSSKWGFLINKLIEKDFKLVSQKSHNIWDEKISELNKELIRIGFSKNQAYIKTGELLNVAFPDIYKDKDPDLVKQRVTYHGKK